MTKTSLEIAIEASGGGKALADSLGVSPMAVSQWKKRGVPAARVPGVVRAAGGRVLAHELRPDLPELFPAPAECAEGERRFGERRNGDRREGERRQGERRDQAA